MFTKLFRGAAFIGVLAVATPALALAVPAYQSSHAVKVNYNTAIEPLLGFGGPVTGTLQLTFNPDGIINGYYRPYGDGSFVQVTGGREGNDIWIDIGERARLHINGTLDKGNITGTAFDQRTQEQYKFRATTS